MYSQWGNDWTWWFLQSSSEHLINPNITLNNYIYELNYIDIYAYNIKNGSGNYIIANNLTAESNTTSSLSFSQEFVAPNLITINKLYLYLNYSLPTSELYRLEVSIYNETIQDKLDYNETWDTRQDVSEWVDFEFSNNILEKGVKYNIIFTVWFDSAQDYQFNNFWKTSNHTGSDQGYSRINNGMNWIILSNDNKTDFLCNFDYDILIHPSKIDLKFIVEGEVFIPYYRKGLITSGYEAYLSYDFISPPEHQINVTAVANQSVDYVIIDVYPRYVYLINITGSFNTTGNQIQWEILYPYKDVSGGSSSDFFLFERDWTLDHFYNPGHEEFEDLFFGVVKLWNKSYNGIIDIWTFPLEQDIYTGIFHSSNYFNGFVTQNKLDNDNYVDVQSFTIGQTIRLEAGVKSLDSEPISGGSGRIELISPSGVTIYNETNLVLINGTINSSDIMLNNGLEAGDYTINFFWTNGRKVAHSSTIIEIKAQSSLPQFIFPANKDSTLMMILIGLFATAAIATPVGILVRKKLQEKDWEKSCRNLFILAKNGVSLYAHSFGIEYQDPTLISGMLSAISTFIRDAIGSKKELRTIDQEDKKILLTHGKYTITALIAEKDLTIMHKQLEYFTNDFEKQYGPLLKDWTGNVGGFKGVEKLIDKYFPMEMEEKIIRGVRRKIEEFMERILSVTEPADVISIFREITEFSAKYQEVINRYYSKQYKELLKFAEDKVQNA
ncbi:MAG: hypothetical protein ACTSRG_15905 [Candidatus Helarchaeota archaeon]